MRAQAMAEPGGKKEGYALSRLALADFRSYERAELVCDERPVVLAGPNGAGKTNALEAVSLLSPGRGLRGAKLIEMARETEGARRPFAIAAEVRGEADLLAGTGLVLDDAGIERRVVHLNGAPASGPSALAGVLRLLWLTPAMDRLFAEGAGARRKFLDRLVLIFDPAHAVRSAAYERAMRERLRLLKEGRLERSWLDGLEAQMAAHGVAIAAARKDAVCRLNARLQSRGASAFPRAELALAGAFEALFETMTALAAEDRFLRALAENRARDAEAARTLFGPHLADLSVLHVAKNRRAPDCSTGEQKALLVAIVLAAARLMRETGERLSPVLLLDEIAAHLDPMRRAALFDEILALRCQAWMTGTEISLFAPLGRRAQGFAVLASRFQPVPLGGA